MRDFKSVADLLSDESRWSRRFRAEDADGNEVHYRSNKACRFCMDGAMKRFYTNNDVFLQKYRAVSRLAELKGFGGVEHFNDNNTHDAVLALVREAGV